jgi:hypothetical protein
VILQAVRNVPVFIRAKSIANENSHFIVDSLGLAAIVHSTRLASDRVMAKKLWQVSTELTRRYLI